VIAVLVAFARGARDRPGDGEVALPPDQRVEVLLQTQARNIKRLQQAVRQLAGGERRLADLMQLSVQHVGVVRFDAFDDMGGRLSFSAALLDAHGDGLVVTSINGRSETRTYAKPIRNLSSEHNLSDEEREAIAIAFGSEARNEARSASPTI
jgi:hypothetical protein